MGQFSRRLLCPSVNTHDGGHPVHVVTTMTCVCCVCVLCSSSQGLSAFRSHLSWKRFCDLRWLLKRPPQAYTRIHITHAQQLSLCEDITRSDAFPSILRPIMNGDAKVLGEAMVGVRLNTRGCGALSTSMILSFSPHDDSIMVVGGAAAAAAPFSYWWECTRSEDAGVEEVDGSDHDDVRYLRCVVPPTAASAGARGGKDIAPPQRCDGSGWRPGRFLGIDPSSLAHAISPGDDEAVARCFVPSATPVAWRFLRSPGGAITLVATSTATAPSLWTCPIRLRSQVVAPPCIDISVLLNRSPSRQSCDRSADAPGIAADRDGEALLLHEEDAEGDVAERQLIAMQRILDASQDVGYFFISGCEVLEERATTLVQRLQLEATEGRNATASREASVRIASTSSRDKTIVDQGQVVAKHTLHTSTGTVKVSSSPLQYQRVVPPCWLQDATVQGAVLPYYNVARSVALTLMEAIAQEAVDEDHLYFLMRSVLYPPGGHPAAAGASDGGADAHKEVEATGRRGSDGHDAIRDENAVHGRTTSHPPPPVLEVHTDKSWLTILVSSSIHGLSFAAPDGEAFHPVVHPSVGALRIVPSGNRTHGDGDLAGVDDANTTTVIGAPSTLRSSRRCDLSRVPLVNIGDAFQMKSGGALLSRPHMATNVHCMDENALRVSVPLFVEPGVGYWPTPYDATDVMVVAI